MSTCVTCLSYIPTDCIKSDEQLSFDYNNLTEVLKKLDDNSKELKSLLTTKLDKKWIPENHEYITEYIQDIVNKIDVIINTPAPQEVKYTIPGTLTGGTEKSLLQILTILVRKVEALEAKSVQTTSQLYIANV